MWNPSNGNLLKTYYGHDDFIRRLVLDKEGNMVSAGDDKTVIIWDIKTGEIMHSLEAHKDYVYGLAVLKNGNLATGSRDGEIKICIFFINKKHNKL
jgi:WD40 repeat protein